jgi:serine/threonine-protein kinase ATR
MSANAGLHLLLNRTLLIGLSIASLGAAESITPRKPLFRDFMGLNTHTIGFRPELYRPVASLVRDYHPVEWDLGKDTDFVTPFPEARNGVNWLSVYGSWKKQGWRIDASLMFETIPRDRWKDLSQDSRAYAEHFARAFGPSGTNALVESVEIGNEPGKFSDQDYRTVFENMALGFKAGDPKLRVATGALTTGKSHAYAKSVECIAGLEPFYDILNFHSYAELKGWPTWQRSYPEDPRLTNYLGDIRGLCNWRDQHAPGKEVWLTEFGYDATTRAPDPKSEFKEWIGVTEKQQAQWTVRSWMQFTTLPVDRAYLYYFNDDDTPHVHGSSGLTRNFKPKPAFYAVAHLRHTLADYRFTRVVLDRTPEALIYEFTHATIPQRRIWVAWSPTGDDRSVSVKLPDFEGLIDHVESMPLQAGEAEMRKIPTKTNEISINGSLLYIFIKSSSE